jgi:hypothetical protein
MSQSIVLETRSVVSSVDTSARSTRLGTLVMNPRQRMRRIRSKRRGSGRRRVIRSLTKRSLVRSHDIRNVALQVGRGSHVSSLGAKPSQRTRYSREFGVALAR